MDRLPLQLIAHHHHLIKAKQVPCRFPYIYRTLTLMHTFALLHQYHHISSNLKIKIKQHYTVERGLSFTQLFPLLHLLAYHTISYHHHQFISSACTQFVSFNLFVPMRYSSPAFCCKESQRHTS